MTALNPSDEFLVNDGTETKTTTWQEMKLGKSSTALNDGDLFLVNDGTKTETVTWLQVKQEAGTAPVIDSVTLAEDTPDTKERFTNQAFTTTYVMAEDGKPASTKTMRAWVLSELDKTIETDEIIGIDEAATDEIIANEDVTGPTWSNFLTANQTINNPERAFNGTAPANGGDSNNYAQLGTKDGVFTFAPEPPLFLPKGSKVFSWLGLQMYFTFQGQQSADGGSGSTEEVIVTTEDCYLGPAGELNGLTVYPLEQFSKNYVTSLGQITLNDTVLKDDDSWQKITFASNKNLAGFGSGEFVKTDDAGITFDAVIVDSSADNPSMQGYGPTIVDSGKLKPTRQEVKRLELNFTTNKDLQYFENGDAVNQDDGAASGIVALADADNSIITLSEITGTWGPENTGRYAIGPTKTISDVKQYLKLDALGSDVFEVKELRSNPDNLEVSLSTYDVDTKTGTAQIKFGATLGVDDVPDDVLPINTSIKTEITALNGIENPDKTNVKESNLVTPISVSGPQATMYGLRFDASRKTLLRRKNTVSSNRKQFTFSAWIKRTELGGIQRFFNGIKNSNPADDWTAFMFEFNDKLRIGNYSSSLRKSVETFNEIGKWFHLVVAYDLDAANVADKVKAWKNGVEIVWENTNDDLTNSGVNADGWITLGAAVQPLDGDAIQDDGFFGYMSDVYQVDGQVLPPKTFGEDFEGKWGPLGSSDVLAKIEEGPTPPDGEDWNTSQVWSDGGVGTTANGSFANVFDGSTSTFAGPKTDAVDYVINFSGFDSITTLELYIVGANNNSGANYLKVNGDPVTASVSGDWQSISASSLSSITFGRNSGNATDLYAVRVDGEILVDKPGFGTNGFYLPFNPDNPGYIYSANLSGDIAAGTNELLFNGNLNDGIKTSNNDGDIIKYMPPEELSGVIEVYSRNGAAIEGDSYSYSTNEGVNWTNVPQPVNQTDGYSYKGWDAVASTINTTTGLWFRNNAGLSNNSVDLRAIRVDGEILIDHNSIGYDASGNDNHFTDENFEFGDGTMYSDGVTSYGKYFLGSIVGIFDGDLQNGRLVMERLSGEAYIKWTGILEDVSTLSVYTERTGYVELKGNLGTATQNYSLGGTITQVPITAVNLATVGSTITEITVHYVDGGDSSFVYLYGIERNGRLLVNASLVDTVFDTPMKNYAVLETGYNGNLQSNSVTGITYRGEANTDYYYEEDGVGKSPHRRWCV